VIRELSLHLVIDGKTFDLTAPGGHYKYLPCFVGTENCTPNEGEIELEPAILRSLVTAHAIGGEALGFPIKLTGADQAALARFATRIGLSAVGPRQ
jgi:hypothetical protein